MKLIVVIRRASLDDFWSNNSGTIKGNLTIVKSLRKVARLEMVLYEWLPPLGKYPLKNEVEMSLA